MTLEETTNVVEQEVLRERRRLRDNSLGTLLVSAFTAVCVYSGIDSLSDPYYADVFTMSVAGTWGLVGLGACLYGVRDAYRNLRNL